MGISWINKWTITQVTHALIFVKIEALEKYMEKSINDSFYSLHWILPSSPEIIILTSLIDTLWYSLSECTDIYTHWYIVF
jgi:hypothetical protein